MQIHFFRRILDRLVPSEALALTIMAIIVGGCAGFAAVFFIRLIEFIQHFSFSTIVEWVPSLGRLWFLIIPVAGALITGPLITNFAMEAKGNGIPEVMKALILRGGRIRPRVAILKILTAAICLGTGGSAGREGPIVQIGSVIGSSLGQVLGLSADRVKNLVACGAAAGIAATFNAPIAGVIFATELFMREIKVSLIGNVVIAAVFSSIISRILLGDHPAFEIPEYTMSSPWEILLYMALGFFAAVIGVMFIRMLNGMESLFDEWKFPNSFKPAIGAILLGLTTLAYPYIAGPLSISSEEMRLGTPLVENIPHIFASGYSFMEEALTGHASFLLMLFFVFLKPITTAFTLGSGNSGGDMAPSLFTGAMLGGAFGYVAQYLFPSIAGEVGGYALVGMAALFTATARAPLTSMLIVFEMSNNYHIILPLMAATMVSNGIAQWMHRESNYTLKLAREGIHFEEGHDLDIMQSVMVEEVMNQVPITIHKNESPANLYQLIQKTHFQGFPVMSDDGNLYGMITLQDMEPALSSEDITAKDLRIANLTTTSPITVYPDEPIWAAIRKMGPRDLARLPVISRQGENKLVGLISRSDILKAYNVGLMRKQQSQFQQERMTLRNVSGVRFLDFCVLSSCPFTEKRLAEAGLPPDIKIVSIERKATILIPNGDTIIRAGDHIVIICAADKIKNAQEYFGEHLVPVSSRGFP